MAQWVRVCAVEECPLGQAREFVAGERLVALFHIADGYYALDGLCPHQGGPLGKGSLAGPVVTCPWHGWQFDVRSGQHQVNRSLRHPQLAVKIEDGGVWVDVGTHTSS
jgi:nitrite reductase (NADH) small subunit